MTLRNFGIPQVLPRSAGLALERGSKCHPRPASLPVSDPSSFQTPSYTTLDPTAFYEITPTLSVNAGIQNVTDERYYSQDVAGIAANNPQLGLYAQRPFVRRQYQTYAGDPSPEASL